MSQVKCVQVWPLNLSLRSRDPEVMVMVNRYHAFPTCVAGRMDSIPS